MGAGGDDGLGHRAAGRQSGRGGLRAIVLSGAGGKAFVAGADIAQMQDFSVAQAEAFAYAGQALSEAIEALPVPLIAAVNGFALGGGCELASASSRAAAAPSAFRAPSANTKRCVMS